MSTHVVGIRPPDDKWRAMKAVWEACVQAGVKIPLEVQAYFNDEEPDSKGVMVELRECTTEWIEQSNRGYDVDLTKLPEDVKIIRFCNS